MTKMVHISPPFRNSRSPVVVLSQPNRQKCFTRTCRKSRADWPQAGTDSRNISMYTCLCTPGQHRCIKSLSSRLHLADQSLLSGTKQEQQMSCVTYCFASLCCISKVELWDFPHHSNGCGCCRLLLLVYQSAVWFPCLALLVWIQQNRVVWQAELPVVQMLCLGDAGKYLFFHHVPERTSNTKYLIWLQQSVN